LYQIAKSSRRNDEGALVAKERRAGKNECAEWCGMSSWVILR
jgi:hypothetical protein